jgi:hypothetical protein
MARANLGVCASGSSRATFSGSVTGASAAGPTVVAVLVVAVVVGPDEGAVVVVMASR